MSWLILSLLVLDLLVSAVGLWKVWAIESRLGFGKVVPVEQIPEEMEKIRSATGKRRRRRSSEADILRELAELDESC